MSKLEECTEHLLLLVASSTSTRRLAGRAGVLVGDYWVQFDDDQRQQFGEWLEAVHADSLRPVFGPGMKDKLRMIEVISGAADALKRKA